MAASKPRERPPESEQAIRVLKLARGLEEPLAANLPGLPRAMLPLVATMVVEVTLRQPGQAHAAIAETKRMFHRYLEPWETSGSARA